MLHPTMSEQPGSAVELAVATLTPAVVMLDWIRCRCHRGGSRHSSTRIRHRIRLFLHWRVLRHARQAKESIASLGHMKRSGHTRGPVREPTLAEIVNGASAPPLGAGQLAHQELERARMMPRSHLVDRPEHGKILTFVQHGGQHATPSQKSAVALLQHPGEDTP